MATPLEKGAIVPGSQSFTASAPTYEEGAIMPTPMNSAGVVQSQAPAGSTPNNDGTHTSPSGVQYTQPPASDSVGRYPTDPGDGINLVGNAAPEDPSAITARISDEYAQEVAAIKSITADQIASQDKVNAQDEGATRATSAATGVLGSDMGNDNQTRAQEQSQSADQQIQSSEESQLAGIQQNISTAAEGEYTTEKSAYTTALQNKISSTQSTIQSMAANTPLSSLSQNEYDSLYASAGFDTPEEFNAYYTAAGQAAKLGTKLVGSDAVGYFLPQIDPTSGNVTYSNVIMPKPTAGSQYGTYQYNPTTGNVETVSPGTTGKIITSGGQLWLVPMQNGSPTGGKAVPLTQKTTGTGSSTKGGWSKATIDQQLAVQSTIMSEAQAANYTQDQTNAAIEAVQSDPTKFLDVLNVAFDSGTYQPTALDSTGSGQTDDSAATAAESAASDAEDAADNASNNSDGTGDDSNNGG